MAKKDVVEEVAVEEEIVTEQEAPQAKSLPTGTVKMIHPDGRIAIVKGCMIEVYSRSGFKEEE